MTIKNCGVCLGKILVRVKSLVSYHVCSCFLHFYLLIYSAVPGLSCRGLLVAAGRIVSYDVLTLSVSTHMGSNSQTGIHPRPPALGVRSLSHWTIREVPYYVF